MADIKIVGQSKVKSIKRDFKKNLVFLLEFMTEEILQMMKITFRKFEKTKVLLKI